MALAAASAPEVSWRSCIYMALGCRQPEICDMEIARAGVAAGAGMAAHEKLGRGEVSGPWLAASSGGHQGWRGALAKCSRPYHRALRIIARRAAPS